MELKQISQTLSAASSDAAVAAATATEAEAAEAEADLVAARCINR